MAQRVDVAEELDRLEAHVKETYNILKKKEAVGRRLDFMMQEFNRESNTLASKSINADVTNSAIELKVLIVADARADPEYRVVKLFGIGNVINPMPFSISFFLGLLELLELLNNFFLLSYLI